METVIIMVAIVVCPIAGYWLYLTGYTHGVQRLPRLFDGGYNHDSRSDQQALEWRIEALADHLSAIGARSDPHMFWARLLAQDLQRLVERTRNLGAAVYELVRQTTPADGEVIIRMPRLELDDIAWMADLGHRVVTCPRESEFRHGERLDKAIAERMSHEIEHFDRIIAPQKGIETDAGHSRSENRSFRMLEWYPTPESPQSGGDKPTATERAPSRREDALTAHQATGLGAVV